MENFWDSSIWGFIILMGMILGSLLIANALRKSIPWLKSSLIPSSVLAGTMLLIVAAIYRAITGNLFFESEVLFAGKGFVYLEMLTYHCLALGFIAGALKSTGEKLTKQRVGEVINTGVTTVSTYLLQGAIGLGITLIVALVIPGFFKAAGVLLPFGYGQGSGQAMNYGMIYEGMGFEGGKSFGLTVAALGFLCASFGGVIHLNIMKRKGKLPQQQQSDEEIIHEEAIQSKNEIPMQESVDKLTIQIALVAVSYLIAYLVMLVLGTLLPGMRNVIYGFNFLLGVLAAVVVKMVLKLLKRIGWMKKEHTNNFLLTRVSNFFYDIMVVAGIGAIRLDMLEKYWGVLLILGAAGFVFTYAYNRLVAKALFKNYTEEQFLAMYGMLSGTASTGIILLREVDSEFKTPAADNLVYQNFPAIVLGFPMMFLATLAPDKPILTLIIFIVFFLVLNVYLFRGFLFKKRVKAQPQEEQPTSEE